MGLGEWIASINGLIVISSFGMLSFIGYALLEFRYFLEDWIPGVKAATLEMIFVLALVGGWQIALSSAYRGNRTGLIALLAITLIPTIITLFDIIFYSPLRYGWPLAQIMLWIAFISCLVSAAAVAIQLIKGKYIPLEG